MSHSFFKFPSTPHLADLGEHVQRQEKVFSAQERERFLSAPVVVEEKIDGANLGISFDDSGQLLLQNRGSLLQPPFAGQWKTLGRWLAPRVDDFFDTLGDQRILFGEWCYAHHSVAYTTLPDFFIVFDIFDKQEQIFWATERRNSLARDLGLAAIHRVAYGQFSLEDIVNMLPLSCYGKTVAEGVYLRREDAQQLHARAKLVRPDFIQTIDVHWSRKALVPNQVVG